MRAHDASWTTWEAWIEVLARTPVAVLYGGSSSEREVSLDTGLAIVDALASGAPPPASVIPVEVRADGRWVLEGAAVEPERALGRLPEEALFLLGLHGGDGEDGKLQGFLEVAGRRHTGSGAAASALCMDKAWARAVAANAGLETARGHLVTRAAWQRDLRGELEACRALEAPYWFAKPRCGGSSVGVVRAGDDAALESGIREILASGDDALVEAAQEGLEVTCALLGNQGEEPLLLPVVEIHPSEGHFFDYREKYAAEGAQEVCPPRLLSPAVAEVVQERALTAYCASRCEGYARADFIVPSAGVQGGGEPVFLELNTLPGLTGRSILPLAAAAVGVEFRALCLELLARACARYQRNAS